MKRLVLFLLIAGVMTGCSASRDVYRIKLNKWSSGPKQSAMTGWNYTK